MKRLCKVLSMLLVSGCAFTACSKKSDSKPDNRLNAVAVARATTAWGGG